MARILEARSRTPAVTPAADRLADQMSSDRPDEVARSERTLPGVWRLRLPLPVARGPARQLVGDRPRRRHRPLRHRDRRRGGRPPARARARPGEAEAARRPPRRLHPLPQRPLRRRRIDRRCRRLRALDAPGVGAHQGDGRGSRRCSRQPDRGRPSQRRSGRGARALRDPPRRQHLHRSRRPAGPRAHRRRRGRHRPRLLPRLRDARPRALARRPPRARERPARLRRPPARPDLALLRPWPHARPRRRVHRLARRRRRARHPPLPARPRADLPRRRREDRPPTARRSTRSSTVRDALRDGEKTPFGVVEAMLGEGNTERARRRLGAAALARLPRSPRGPRRGRTSPRAPIRSSGVRPS